MLLNGKKLYLLDKKDALRGMGLWALRLQFTTENPGEIDKVLMDYQGRAVFDARKLYARTVFARRGISKKEGTSYDHPCIAISPQARADEAHRPAVYRSCRGYRRNDGSGAAVQQEVTRVSRRKAQAIAAGASPDDIVIAADTIVVIDGRELGKPRSEEEALGMLRRSPAERTRS